MVTFYYMMGFVVSISKEMIWIDKERSKTTTFKFDLLFSWTFSSSLSSVTSNPGID